MLTKIFCIRSNVFFIDMFSFFCYVIKYFDMQHILFLVRENNLQIRKKRIGVAMFRQNVTHWESKNSLFFIAMFIKVTLKWNFWIHCIMLRCIISHVVRDAVKTNDQSVRSHLLLVGKVVINNPSNKICNVVENKKIWLWCEIC